MRDYRVLSLFSGAGGLDIGFHKAGFKIVACIEIDKSCCDTLRLNTGRYLDENCMIINGDITKIEPSSLNLGKIDFIIGGPPCQSFSAAGRRAGGVTGINDTRGSLFWYYCQFLEYFKPCGFLFENVRGILQANQAKAWDIIRESFAQKGYSLYYRVLDAADYGVPQHRERLIMVGSKNVDFCFPRPTHGPDSHDKKPHMTVGQAFSDIDDPNEIVPPYGGKYGDLINDIPPGMNYLFYTERMGHQKPKFAWRSKFSGFLYKLDPNALSKTVVAHQGRYDGPFHWKGRKLTLKELKRVQGFPDDYSFVNSKNESIKQVGNSVSPKFAFALAKAVMNQFFVERFPEVKLLSADEKLSFDKRKGEKADNTKRLISERKRKLNQLILFNEAVDDWPNDTFKDQIEYASSEGKITFSRRFKLKEGCWEISIKKKKLIKKDIQKIAISLNFIDAVNKTFDCITGTLESDSFWDISKLWDSIHYCIARCSSYDSVQPLYGHFTEPYPKFTMDIEASSNVPKGFRDWLKMLCDFDYLAKQHSLSTLIDLNPTGNDVMDFIKKLRGNNFDIRVHETNRAIPDGFFRICYPFTNYSEEKTYVVWHEKGEHKTGDVQIVKTSKGYEPKLYSNYINKPLKN